MNKLREIIRYILINSSQPNKLTKTKVTKLVYLVDLQYINDSKRQVTDIKWYFDHYGPYVSDVYLEAKGDPRIEIIKTVNVYGNPKEILKFKKSKKVYQSKLSEKEKIIISSILSKTDNMNWREFIEYIYNTEPIKTNPRYTSLDLHSYTT